MKPMQDIKKIAKLAKLHLNVAEEEKLQQKFHTVIDYINLLQQAPVGEQQLLKDESLQKTAAKDVPNNQNINLNSAYKEGNLFKVPTIIK